MNIPRFLQLYKEERLEEAFESVIMDNPLPSSTGRVCQHPCDNRCRRQTVDEAVNMREVHRFIADSILLSERYEHMVKRILVRRLEPHGPQDRDCGRRAGGPDSGVLSGPAGPRSHGLSTPSPKPAACCDSRCRNIACPRVRCDREIELIEQLGREVRLQHARRRRYPAERTGRPIRCGFHLHRNLERILGVSARHRIEGCVSGADVPGGDRARRGGAASAARWPSSAAAMPPSTRLARRCAKALTSPCFIAASAKTCRPSRKRRKRRRDEGAKFVFLAAPHRIIGDAEGKVEGHRDREDAAGRIRCIGPQKTRLHRRDPALRVRFGDLRRGRDRGSRFRKASGLSLKESGTIEVNRFTLETSRPRFYAGGDVVTGASNVSNAMAYGKQAARNIDLQLMETNRWAKIVPEFEYGQGSARRTQPEPSP